MRKWFLIGGAGAVVGYVAVYFALDVKRAPEPTQPEPVATASAPAEPVVLNEVVDVTNLDPLLEPRRELPPGIPFDSDEPLAPAVPAATPTRIPAAAD
jgi:hypothetical protein